MKTFQSWGSSSILSFRRNAPNGNMRGSRSSLNGTVHTGCRGPILFSRSSSALVTIVRNFHMRNGLPVAAGSHLGKHHRRLWARYFDTYSSYDPEGKTRHEHDEGSNPVGQLLFAISSREKVPEWSAARAWVSILLNRKQAGRYQEYG